MSFHVPEKHRMRDGPRASTPADGNNGMFIWTNGIGEQWRCIASDGMGWDHVSVSIMVIATGQTRLPTWTDMCAIKATFWDDEDAVMQLHPPKSQYVNNHRHVLHLWRPTSAALPLPNMVQV